MILGAALRLRRQPLWLAEVTAANAIFHQAATRNAAEIIDLVRRIRALHQTSADPAAERIFRAAGAITSRLISINRRADQSTSASTNRGACERPTCIPVTIVAMMSAHGAADERTCASTDKGACARGGFTRIQSQSADRGHRNNC